MARVAPWRCFSTSTSARLVARSIFSTHLTCSGVPASGSRDVQVIFLAIDEHHHVGVLLDGAGFAQVRQHRALVVARIDAARQLRQGQDGDVQFLGQGLEALGDLGDFLHPVLVAARRLATNWR